MAVSAKIYGSATPVYFHYDFEDAAFRWDPVERTIFRKFQGQAEVEIKPDSKLLAEAWSTSEFITREQYEAY